jgi:hypothetical protein
MSGMGVWIVDIGIKKIFSKILSHSQNLCANISSCEQKTHGRLAQLVERLPYKQDVTGSSPVLPIS